jgi:hypothetical protein
MMNKTKQQKTEHRELASPNGQETGAVSLPSFLVLLMKLANKLPLWVMKLANAMSNK